MMEVANPEDRVETKTIRKVLDVAAEKDPDGYVEFIDKLLSPNVSVLYRIAFEHLKGSFSILAPEYIDTIFGLVRKYGFDGNIEEADGLTFDVCVTYAVSQEVLPKGFNTNLIGLLLYLFSYDNYRGKIEGILRDRGKFGDDSTVVVKLIIADVVDNDYSFDLRTALLRVLSAWEDIVKEEGDVQNDLLRTLKTVLISIKDELTAQTTPEAIQGIDFGRNVLPLLNRKHVSPEDIQIVTKTTISKLSEGSPESFKNLVFCVFDKLEPGEEAFDEESATKTIGLLNVFNREENGVNLMGRILEVSGIYLFRLKPGLTVDAIFSQYPEQGDPILDKSLTGFFNSTDEDERAKIIRTFSGKFIKNPDQIPKGSSIIYNAKGLVDNSNFRARLTEYIKGFMRQSEPTLLEAYLKVITVIKGSDFKRRTVIYPCFEKLFKMTEEYRHIALEYIMGIYGSKVPHLKKTLLLDSLIETIGMYDGRLDGLIRDVFDNMPGLLSKPSNIEQLRKKIKPGLFKYLKLSGRKKELYREFEKYLSH